MHGGCVMEEVSDDRSVLMGEFHNQVVVLLDGSRLYPPEILVVLRMIILNIEKLFEMSVKGK
jgi:hypothetical protein